MQRVVFCIDHRDTFALSGDWQARLARRTPSVPLLDCGQFTCTVVPWVVSGQWKVPMASFDIWASQNPATEFTQRQFQAVLNRQWEHAGVNLISKILNYVMALRGLEALLGDIHLLEWYLLNFMLWWTSHRGQQQKASHCVAQGKTFTMEETIVGNTFLPSVIFRDAQQCKIKDVTLPASTYLSEYLTSLGYIFSYL